VVVNRERKGKVKTVVVRKREEVWRRRVVELGR